MAEIEIINDWLNDLNKINCKSDFIPSLKRYKEFIEAKSNTENTINPLDFIRPELHTHLQQLEKRINFGGNRIRCAAFCEALKERGYFIDVKSQSTINNPIIKKFALSSYKLDITNQVKTAKKEAREAAKRRLLYLFK